MRPVLLAALTLLWLPTLVRGQAKDDEPDKVSNDRPDRPLQMPPASVEVKEAFDDFERFRKRGAWERALKALDAIPAEQALRFVDGKNGFIIPVARKRREVLAGLPAEGLAAYRLFYDDDAKKLLGRAEGADELKTLERVFSTYFPTTVGDNAADRLGDLYFEMGRFDRAADCWLAVLRDHPDTDLSPALVSLKAALALSRAGRTAEAVGLRRELTDRYSGETVKVAGRSATVDDQQRRYLGDGAGETARPSDGAASESGPHLGGAVPASWQVRFGESVVAGMSPAEQTQWESNPLSGAVPAVAVHGSRLYGNYLGYVFAVDLTTGKLVWRSGSFHNVEVAAAQGQVRMIDPARFAVVASASHVWSLGRDLKDPNQMAPFRLACRRADGGDLVWQSTDLPDYAQVDLLGAPLLVGETLFVAARTPMNQQQQGQAHQYVLAVRAVDGKLLWKAEVGALRQGQQFFYYGMSDKTPQPGLAHQAGSVYVDTHEGVLARLDAGSGELDWGYGYPTEPANSNSRFFMFNGMMPTKESSSASGPLRSGEALFVKGAKSGRLCALDPDRMAVLWDRPIAKSARLLGADDRAVYLGGPEVTALDRRTRALLWSTRVPGGSAEGRVLVRRGGLWQLTPRGVFELDPGSGRVLRIFRGDDTGADGGDLYLTDRLLLAVTNRAISAYPTASAVAGGGGGGRASTPTPTGASND